MKNFYILYIYYAINKKRPGRQTSAGSFKGYSPFFFFSFLRLFETALSRLSIYFFGFLKASFQVLDALNTPPMTVTSDFSSLNTECLMLSTVAKSLLIVKSTASTISLRRRTSAPSRPFERFPLCEQPDRAVHQQAFRRRRNLRKLRFFPPLLLLRGTNRALRWILPRCRY